MGTRSSRGPYSKGIARRSQILKAALDAYARSGPQGPSLKSIAGSVGLTEAGVLHYFDGKDDLFVAILKARDAEDAEKFDLTSLDGVWDLLAHTTETPGLVKLFVDMTAASTNPDHPASEFMRKRTKALLGLVEGFLGPENAWQARILLAAAEGLQIQWLRDPATDIVGDLRRLHRVLTEPATHGSGRAPGR